MTSAPTPPSQPRTFKQVANGAGGKREHGIRHIRRQSLDDGIGLQECGFDLHGLESPVDPIEPGVSRAFDKHRIPCPVSVLFAPYATVAALKLLPCLRSHAAETVDRVMLPGSSSSGCVRWPDET